MAISSPAERPGEGNRQRNRIYEALEVIMGVKGSGVHSVYLYSGKQPEFIIVRGGTKHKLFDPRQHLPTTRLEEAIRQADHEHAPDLIVRATRFIGYRQDILDELDVPDGCRVQMLPVSARAQAIAEELREFYSYVYTRLNPSYPGQV